MLITERKSNTLPQPNMMDSMGLRFFLDKCLSALVGQGDNVQKA